MGNIVIIGPRGVGKTTYLAGLSYWEKFQFAQTKKKIFTVEPLNDDAKKLRAKAENIICQGERFLPTEIPIGGVLELPIYSFTIEVKKRFKASEKINLLVRDFAGELFDDLYEGFKSSDREQFFRECLKPDISGCLILFTDWQETDDNYYNKALEIFTYLIDLYERNKDYRIAIAISKCERGELWPSRIEPERDLFGVHLPQTKLILEKKILKKNLHFYALSTFGVLGINDPRPNRIDELDKQNSVLKDRKKWQPYNLIAPLYWLSTGKNIQINI